MNADLAITFINTVSSDYEWDDGLPSQNNLIPIYTLSAQSTNSSGLEYVCYAPQTIVMLSSTNTTRTSSVAIKRTVDFGDYYNSAENIVTTSLTGTVFFSHVYIMPGLYTITMTEEEYVIAPNPKKIASSSYSASSPLEKQQELQTSWHWKEYKDIREDEFPATWENLKFQNTLKFKKPTQLTWFNTRGCLSLPRPEIYWQWNNLVNDIPPNNKNANRVTWNDAVSSGDYAKTWNSIIGNCNVDDFVLSAAPVRTIKLEKIIRVLEVSPIAYLSGNQPTELNNREFPLTVRLTPRFTQSGSLPIEKIVWDLGDGSPLLTRRRWESSFSFPFVYSGALSADFRDPRNFDVVHTYEKNDRGQYTFYPSITAYSSSTSTSDIAATVVGPIKTETFNVSSFAITQNYLNEKGALLLGEIDKTAALWKVDN
jgi:hypothetical protein